MPGKIEIKCKGHKLVAWRELRGMQGKLKTMTAEEKDILKYRIKTFGFKDAFRIWEGHGEILDGHQRKIALHELEEEGWEVPDKLPADMIMAKSRKEAIRDLLGFVSQFATVDDGELAGMIDAHGLDFSELEGEISIPGLNMTEFKRNWIEPNGYDPKEDEIPEEVEPRCKYGELWQLGDHRLLCGDATKREDVERLMDGEKADMVFTDPPYAVGIGKKNRDLQSVQPSGRITEDIKNDNLSVKETAEKIWKPAFELIGEVLSEGGAYYITAPQGGDQMMMMMMMMKGSIPCRHEIIWVKNQPTFSLGRLDYDYKHEPILYGWKGSHRFYGRGKFTKSVWPFDRERKCDLHPTMKPVDLIENAILNSAPAGGLIVDNFVGSGSTIIACEKQGRKCYAMDDKVKYCDVTIERWEQFTGQKAETRP